MCTLALEIGAKTAIFSVVNAVFLRPLPYREPESLVWAAEPFPRYRIPMTMMLDVAAWRSGQTVFEFLAKDKAIKNLCVAATQKTACRQESGPVGSSALRSIAERYKGVE